MQSDNSKILEQWNFTNVHGNVEIQTLTSLLSQFIKREKLASARTIHKRDSEKRNIHAINVYMLYSHREIWPLMPLKDSS